MMTRHGVPEVRSTGFESRAKNPIFLSVKIPPRAELLPNDIIYIFTKISRGFSKS